MDENTIMHVVMAGWIGAGLIVAAWLLLAPRYRADRRRALRAGGISTAIVGTMTVLGALFVPFGVYTTHTAGPEAAGETTIRMESLWTMGIEPVQILMLVLILGASLIVGLSTHIHQSGYTQSARWKAALLLIVITVLASFTIGWMFVPVMLLALITAIQGARTEEAHSGDESRRPEHEREPFPETG
jgi:hypothetical protein